MKHPKVSKNAITGVVVASRWNREGHVNGVSIRGSDSREYIVKLNDCGKELLAQIDARVRILGKITDRLDGRQILHIEKYDILGSRRDSLPE
jgi:hypothetical protein